MSPQESSDASKPLRLWNWYRRQRSRVDGVVILAIGIGVLVWAGLLSSSTHPPSTAELGVLLTAAAVLQVWAGATFGRTGHVDPEKAKSAVRRLVTLGLTTQSLQVELESAVTSEDPSQQRECVIRADEALSAFGFHLTDAIADWTDIHAEALAETIASLKEQKSRFISTGANDGD